MSFLSTSRTEARHLAVDADHLEALSLGLAAAAQQMIKASQSCCMQQVGKEDHHYENDGAEDGQDQGW